MDCERLERVTFQSGSALVRLGKRCFARTALAELLMPKTLEEIGDGAFLECKVLRGVVLNEGLKVLGTAEHSVE